MFIANYRTHELDDMKNKIYNPLDICNEIRNWRNRSDNKGRKKSEKIWIKNAMAIRIFEMIAQPF